MNGEHCPRQQLLTKVSGEPHFNRHARTRRSSRSCRPRRRCGGRTATRARRSPTSAARRACRRRCSTSISRARRTCSSRSASLSTDAAHRTATELLRKPIRRAGRDHRRPRDAGDLDARQHAGTADGGDPRGLPPGTGGPRPPRTHVDHLRRGVRRGRWPTASLPADFDAEHVATVAQSLVSEGARHWAAGRYQGRSFADVVGRDIAALVAGHTRRD